MGLFEKIFGTYSSRELKKIQPIVDSVLALEETYKALTDEQLQAITPKLKERLNNGETLNDILPDAFAAIREASDRVLGMRHFPVQIIGGVVLHQGRIAQMRTGEGKTLVATLPGYLNALSEKGVHVITVNDYLAKHNADEMGKVYRFMGLSVGLIVNGIETTERRKAYAFDITYGTNNEFGFDYLRDNMVVHKTDKVQREHNFAIVDEVDSILIDEARTPLIISGQGDKSTDLYKIVNKFARTLTAETVKETDAKVEDDESTITCDYIIDEKGKTATLTPHGVKKAEKYFHIDNLIDAEHITLQHHINQAIRSHGLMKRDIDYVVKDGEVIIVDEFTGRLMNGRRYNEGLHQAIEAKENVKIERESKTLATITFQNYFRMYKKLSGMTGTAMTEESEFREIYHLDVVEIPTNKPVQRLDNPDSVFKTEKGKYSAVIEQVVECNKKGQPVLVGTVSIEKSELLSGMLKRRGVKHEVLNAKHHEKEAEIVAQAGKFSAVTIATNMAGRGTDIMLGGNADVLAYKDMKKQGFSEQLINEASGFFETTDETILNARKVYKDLVKKYKEQIVPEAEKVVQSGGLFIIGTERHESRRIDNQLRGRAGRQGDPGESRFYISLEDDLMRLFGGERMQAVMEALKVEEDMPIENGMLSRSIEGAQSKIEGRNFAIRKNVLQFDDVMNKQREIIYSQRAKVLGGEDMHEYMNNMIDGMIDATVNIYLSAEQIPEDWNLEGLRDYFMGWITVEEDLRYDVHQLAELSINDIKSLLKEKAHAIYKQREETLSPTILRDLERIILLKNVDTHWMAHIDNMEELKRGIYLRSYAQKDPVIEYRLEGFDMFDQMIDGIRTDTMKSLFMVQVSNMAPAQSGVPLPKMVQIAGDVNIEQIQVKEIHEHTLSENVAVTTGTLETLVVDDNEPCPCGSSKKYKKCCKLIDSK